jgi:AcrR family transcriptional regulator
LTDALKLNMFSFVIAPAHSQIKTAKGRATRERLLQAARHLFTTEGYSATTMRDVAAEAGCATGLAYRYFTRREELALAIYTELALDFEARSAQLPDGTVAERFAHVMQVRLEQLRPHRAMLRALLPVALDASSGLGVFSANATPVRERVAAVFARVTDTGKGVDARLTRVLYLAHHALLLVWLLEARADDAASRAALALCVDALRLSAPLLGTAIAGRALAGLENIIQLMVKEEGEHV